MSNSNYRFEMLIFLKFGVGHELSSFITKLNIFEAVNVIIIILHIFECRSESLCICICMHINHQYCSHVIKNTKGFSIFKFLENDGKRFNSFWKKFNKINWALCCQLMQNEYLVYKIMRVTSMVTATISNWCNKLID